MSSAPKGDTDTPPPTDEAIERTLDVLNDGQELQGMLYTGGHTEYAHIYLAAVTGTYNGNEMLWLNYIWLSKPGAYESDMWGDNGISIRLVDGIQQPLLQLMASVDADSTRYLAVGDGDAQ